MIAYIDGRIAEKSPTYVYIDIGGLAYHVHISLQTFERIEAIEKVKLWIYAHIKEDAHQLYGFFEKAEKQLFTQLISVNGVGPNTARVILSYMTTSEAISAIVNDMPAAFHKVKGVGPKTAKRIILDLKDKVAVPESDQVLIHANQGNTTKHEALSALVALGFQKSQVLKVLDRIIREEGSIPAVEELVKRGLQDLT